jgi:hypothetical protein
MKFNTFKVEKQTDVDLSHINMGDQHCGLFRCPLEEASTKMPEFAELFDSAPVADKSDWEVDLKIHMLMPDQFPCLPNWHCDNVPRYDGMTDYSKCDETVPRMLLWVSGAPYTEFLKEPLVTNTPMSHADLAETIQAGNLETVKIKGQCWVSMDQMTPHRGTIATEGTWRVFVRLTHKSIAPVRPVNNVIRRHCQVYLNPNSFSW